MKRNLLRIMIIIVMLTAICTQTISAASFVYKDEETGLSFTVPNGWTETDLMKEREVLKKKYIPINDDTGASIMYGWVDLWGEMGFFEKRGYTRATFSEDAMSEEIMATFLEVPETEVETVSYGEHTYYKVINESIATVYGITIEYKLTYLATMHDGYLYTFQMGMPAEIESQSVLSDFEKLLNSVEYPALTPNRVDEWDMFAANLILSIILTIGVYSLPIFIYRYGIRKRPLSPEKAKKITIIYAIGAFFVMTALLIVLNGEGAAGGAIILWSYVNYRTLTAGYNPFIELLPANEEIEKDKPESEIPITPQEEPDTKVEQPVVAQEQTVLFCHRCGTKLQTEGAFCHKCGAKIIGR